jgi:hypothetical protein
VRGWHMNTQIAEAFSPSAELLSRERRRRRCSPRRRKAAGKPRCRWERTARPTPTPFGCLGRCNPARNVHVFRANGSIKRSSIQRSGAISPGLSDALSVKNRGRSLWRKLRITSGPRQ